MKFSVPGCVELLRADLPHLGDHRRSLNVMVPYALFGGVAVQPLTSFCRSALRRVLADLSNRSQWLRAWSFKIMLWWFTFSVLRLFFAQYLRHKYSSHDTNVTYRHYFVNRVNLVPSKMMISFRPFSEALEWSEKWRSHRHTHFHFFISKIILIPHLFIYDWIKAQAKFQPRKIPKTLNPKTPLS